MADVTLKQGIEVMIMDEVEGITGVVDVTDMRQEPTHSTDSYLRKWLKSTGFEM
ncbi:MAG: hypothetical protein Ct9H90mP16_08340 [Candidatus Poseidoniales archaeon]|nr:MAG: hypothetical protein Ct9H90mP16_08340 [Candidatus Poseidoniales archaeon]